MSVVTDRPLFEPKYFFTDLSSSVTGRRSVPAALAGSYTKKVIAFGLFSICL
jgi:hypothetical protein